MRYLLPLLLILTLCTCDRAVLAKQSSSQTVTLSNVEPRKTLDGKIVDAHDGRIIQFGDYFYWYGTQYGSTNGFTKANAYHVYRSPDLVSWEHIGPALKDAPAGIYYRPHVIYHAASDQYMLWYNWYPELWDGHFGVATSKTPEGPFIIHSSDVEVAHSELGVGDFGLFVDDDQTAYISYNTIDGHRVSVEKLTEDYLGSTKENGGYIAQYCEAGSMFKRNGIYYLLTDYTCCFCNQGAGARVYMADDPLGEWTLTNNINRQPGWRAANLTDGRTFTTEYTALKRMEDSTFQHLILDLKPGFDGNSLKLTFFTGNRSGQCGQVELPDVHQRIVLPSFQVEYYDHGWQSLLINDSWAASSNMTETLGFGFDRMPETTQLRFTPNTDYPYDEVRFTEVSDQVAAAWVSNGQPGPIIIPAQQTYVMDLATPTGTAFIWMGDLWGSASDNIKGHDFQYWSSPLKFDEQGWIAPLELEESFTVALK